MKAESLFHLLQIRARTLEQRADPACRQKMQALQATLRVSHTRGWFEVTWRLDERDYSVSVPEQDFTFYVAGDTAKAVEQRGTTGNVRQRNWVAAAALWQRMGEVSGFVLPAPDADEAMGLVPAKQPPARQHQFLGAAIAIIAGFAATALHAGFAAGLSCGLVALLLAALMPSLGDTQLRRPFSVLEVVVAMGGAFLPGWLGGDPLWLAPLLAGLTLMTWLEGRDADLPLAWGVAGILVGGTSFWLGLFMLLPVLVFTGALVALRLLAPRRLMSGDVGWLICGAVIGLIAGTIAHPRMAASDALHLSALATGGLLLLAFAFWSFHGILFRLTPWLAIGMLGLAAIASSFQTGSALGIGGFALVIAVRLAVAFIKAATPRIPSPSGTGRS